MEKTGFEPSSVTGVTVQADQTLVEQISTVAALKVIGGTRSRGDSSLVRAGVTSDVYNITPVQQAAAAPLGGGNNQNAAYSAIASSPGTLVPISNSPGWGQSIFIRGGDYTQTGNEVDGIPINRAFDQYAGSPLSNLGNAEVQVYTGGQPADAQANGLAGFINQVIRTGTYPGFADVQIGVGGPAYYHKLGINIGGSTPNRNFSYYLGFLGYNQENRFIDQFNGSSYIQKYGSTINYIAQNCGTSHPSAGCYVNSGSANVFGLPIGPNGYVPAGYFGSLPSTADREGVANFHIGLPHPHDGIKDDIQLLYNTGQIYNQPNASLQAFGSSQTDVANGTAFNGAIPNDANGLCGSGMQTPDQGPVACAAPVSTSYIDQNFYTGPLNSALTTANLGSVLTQREAGSPGDRPLNGAISANSRDGETNGFAIEKVQYQHNFSSNAYARLYGYSLYTDRIDGGPVGALQNYVGNFSSDYVIRSHSRGLSLQLADQINQQNLLSLNTSYSYSDSTRARNDVTAGLPESPVAYLVNSLNPTAGCYGATGNLSSCSSAAQYRLPPVGGSSLVPRKGSPVLGTEGALMCGTGPCEYFAINNGAREAFNEVRPAFSNASLSDIFKPNDKLTVTAGLRYEDFTYNLLDTNTVGNQLFVNDYNNSHCVSGTAISTRKLGAACAAGTVATALTAQSPNRINYGHIFSPRFGATYQLDSNTVLRGSYGRYTQPAETSAVQATNVQAGTPSAPFYANFGFPSYARFVEPEISYNSDFSVEHNFPRADTQVKVTPFYRQSNNEFVAILVDPKTQFIANVNGLNRRTSGVELAISKGSFARDGFAAALSYTYTNARAKYKVFSNGGSFVAGANAAIQQFNGYTKFCAQNPNDKMCGTPVNAAGAAPCYTAAGAADTCATVGAVANPYYNSKPFALLDPNAEQVPYNVSLGVGNTGGATSYIVPHVASLILNYKKGPLTITPSFQIQAGSKYGSPLAAQGIAPDSCSGTLASAVAGDPRYPNGTPGGGAPYDASTCSNLIAIPNPQTGHFDGIGEYTQPTLLATNLSVNYDLSKKISLNVVAANIFNRCFGGTNAKYTVGNLGCAYGQSGLYVGNSYNPGDTIQPYVAQSYSPVLGGALQSVSAGSPLPFSLYTNLTIRL